MRRLPLVLLALVAASTALAAGGWRVVGTDTERGALLIASAHASVSSARGLAVRVTSSPRYGVGGNWEARCDGTVLHGHLHGRTPFTRVLPLPGRRPQGCGVLANVTYATRGTLTVQILAR